MTMRVATLTFTAVIFLSQITNATISVVIDFSGDGSNEGFNDPTTISDPDVPTASTLGEARRIVVQSAADRLGQFFEPKFVGDVWRMTATFDPLGGILASAGPDSFVNGSTFTGGVADVMYPIALANNLNAGQVTGGTGNLVVSNFDSTIDFDFNMTGPPALGQESLFATTIHELLHGIGFFHGYDSTGAYDFGFPTIYDTFLTQGDGGAAVTGLSAAARGATLSSNALFWSGAQGNANRLNPGASNSVGLHSPNPVDGSEGSHTSAALYDSVGDVMLPGASPSAPEPLIPSAMDIGMMFDIGWTPMVIPEPGSFVLLGVVGGFGFVVRLIRKRKSKK